MSRRPVSVQVCSAATPIQNERRKAGESITQLKRLIPWLTVVALGTNLVAAPKRILHTTRASGEEPFCSFRILDAKLTLLTNQQADLKAALNTGQVSSGSRVAMTASRSMSSAAGGIERIAGRLERLYKTRHRPFGVRMFGIMRTRAGAVQRGVNAVATARTRSAAELAEKRLDEQIVSLIVQFQAASGGYGATRCQPPAWTCCEPKRSKDLIQSEQVACAWVCVATSQTCTGFLGPRIPRP